MIDRVQKAGQLYTSGLQAVTRGGDSLHHLAQHLPLMVKGTHEHPGPLWTERAVEPDGKIVRLDSFLDYLTKPAREGLHLPSLHFLQHVLEAAKGGDKALVLVRDELRRVDGIDFAERADRERKELLADPNKVREEKGGDRRSKQFQANNVSLKQHGNSAAYLAARLARYRPDLSARTLLPKGDMLRLSLRAAAIEAGFIKPPSPLEAAIKAYAKLSPDEQREFWHRAALRDAAE